MLPFDLSRTARTAARLTERVSAVCPIQGVSLGDWADKGTWRIDFAEEASAPQRDAARAVVAAFDPDATER